MTLSFSSFNTEMNYDKVLVYDGSTLRGTFSGVSIPQPIVSSGPSLRIQFSADDSVQADGFVATLTLRGP